VIPTIHINHLSLTFGEKIILSNITLDLLPGRWVGLLGPSGVGKTSLLRILAGLQPTNTWQGTITTDNGITLSSQVAYMGQTDLLLPWLNVLDNTALILKLKPHTRIEAAHIQAQAQSLLTQVGLDNTMQLYPHQLSGGMRQRVALVRTLLSDKPIILMDEPFSALDAITRYKLQGLAMQLLENKTVLFITHDPAEALRLADDIYILQGEPATLKPLSNVTNQNATNSTIQQLLFDELVQASTA